MGNGRVRPQATCCPDKPHWAKGFCKSCYWKAGGYSIRYRRSREAMQKWRMQKYGITPADYDRMMYEQKGQCAICKQEPDITRPRPVLFVDHNHTTGKVRALLCKACNSALGLLKEDARLFRRAIAYLKKHNKEAR